MRVTRAGEEILVAINFSNQPFRGVVEIESAGGFAEVGSGSASLPAVSLDAWGYRIWERGRRARR
jgi:hypothetical protein